jgi:hypothetical protein
MNLRGYTGLVLVLLAGAPLFADPVGNLRPRSI